ncbi:potassium transporter TrkA [Starkeya sp. ORNL1]|uniref:monovalent cation:proton antiporter-2 (CPA2) family protein n=1 Tax=Starkeya sp. ORNL1 TaxID=2709380 RepID=UPI001463D9D8|nr:monovalent cation:proton antiporter-2 (CPA2) family protein [Starkeya sp. ORNL1]QJP15468.1 potassium transporter TrkA [Starkeya sp. ORNL1]
MQHGEDIGFLFSALSFLAAAVGAVIVSKRLGLSPIIGYLFVGIIIGPFGLGVFRDPHRVFTLAEIGIVMLLFVIGLEMQLSRIFALRFAIFGLGTGQLFLSGLGIGVLVYYGGENFDWRASTIAGLALALSATSIALQLLGERNGLSQPYGQRAFAVLLFQDIAVVPLLAVLPLLATNGNGDTHTLLGDLTHVGLIAVAITVVVLIGRYVLTPLFRLLAQSGAREAMTAAALLVVLGAGTLMLEVGMSMALGAFLAGVVLSESSFRHEIEANIDAFRGLLLALFFMSVGMAVDLNVVIENAPRLIGATLLVTLAKAAFVWAVFRVNCKTEAEAIRSASVLTPAGEFSFVLFPLGLSLGLLTQHQTDMLVAVAVMTMLLGPPVAALGERLARRLDVPAEEPDAEEDFSGANGSVLVVGFGRFGQIVSQCLLAQGMEVTIIDNDVEMIQSAGRFGFRIYYGDGTRLDVLRAAGAERARVIAICVDRRETTDRIVDILTTNVPDARLHVRSYDRVHTLALQAKGVDYEIRETFESALAFGLATLRAAEVDAETAESVVAEVRVRDRERLLRQAVEGIDAIPGRTVEPEPLTSPAKTARPLNPEAEDVLGHETEFSS